MSREMFKRRREPMPSHFWIFVGALVASVATAALGNCGASAKPPRYGLHIVDGGTTPLVQDRPRESLVLRRDFVPYKAAPASMKNGAGRTIAWREEDGSIHIAEGVTAEDVARLVFELADWMAEATRAASDAMRGAYR